MQEDVFQEHEVFHVHPELRCGLFTAEPSAVRAASDAAPRL